MGVKPGYKVTVWCTNVPAWYITFWACCRIGAVLVTMNTAYKIHEAEYLLRQSDTHTLVMIDHALDSDYAGIINELCPEIKTSKPGQPLHCKALPFLRNVITYGFSMPGCLGKREEALTKAYKSVLESEGYEVIYYQKDDYPEFGQFTKIKESIKTASAMIAFGFRQAKITAGTAFPGTVKESPIKDKWSHTPWNEVEVGMALMHGLPVLLVKDEGIDSGIFDSKLSEAFVATILADYDSRKIDTNKDFAKWLSQIGKPCDLNGILFHQPRCSYSEKTPGYVDIGVGERVAVLQGGAAHGRKAILYCHGNGEDIHESTKAMADFIPPGVFFAAVAYAGYGLSDGEQSEVGCYKNAHRLYDWLRTERGFAPEDILVVGYSLGTGVALELASTCRVRAVLLQAPYLSGRSLIEYWYPELAQKLLKDVNPFPSNEYLEKVTCPVAAIHGTGDDVVPLVQGQTLYDMVRVKAGFVAVQDAGHGNVLATLGAPRYKEIIDGLFART